MANAQKITVLLNLKTNQNLEREQEIVTLCRNGLHDLNLSNAKTTKGACRMCQRAADVRYRHSEKGQLATARHRPAHEYYKQKDALNQSILRKIAQITHLERLLGR